MRLDHDNVGYDRLGWARLWQVGSVKVLYVLRFCFFPKTSNQ